MAEDDDSALEGFVLITVLAKEDMLLTNLLGASLSMALWSASWLANSLSGTLSGMQRVREPRTRLFTVNSGVTSLHDSFHVVAQSCSTILKTRTRPQKFEVPVLCV